MLRNITELSVNKISHHNVRKFLDLAREVGACHFMSAGFPTGTRFCSPDAEKNSGDYYIMTHPEAIVEGAPSFILASASPRRNELLASVGLDFTVIPSTAEEPPPRAGETPEEYATRMAVLKAREVAARNPGRLILAADTVVALGNAILGKPADMAHALRMLEGLCGKKHATAEERVAGVRRHAVTTGCCWLDGRATAKGGGAGEPAAQEQSFAVTTQVLMSLMDTAVLERYVATREAMDKAGGYAIQGKAGFMVRAIDGSYSNVVGLPLAEVVEALVD